MLEHAESRCCVFVMLAALLWAVGLGGAHASPWLGPTFVTAAPIVGQSVRLMNMCAGAGSSSSSMGGMACSADCAVASGLIPILPTLPAIAPLRRLPSPTMALEDHRPPPDPHPPKPSFLG
jgi:hypothetical protein